MVARKCWHYEKPKRRGEGQGGLLLGTSGQQGSVNLTTEQRIRSQNGAFQTVGRTGQRVRVVTSHPTDSGTYKEQRVMASWYPIALWNMNGLCLWPAH
jgi:hypothetical protein